MAEKEKHIDVTRCAECGCDRGGFIDLSAKDPVLVCFECKSLTLRGLILAETITACGCYAG